MSRAMIVIRSKADRERAAEWAFKAPYATRIEFKAEKRTIPQNAKLYAMLTDVATQLAWHGMKLRVQDWKILFLDALKRELRAVPNLDGTGFVNLGRSSSDLSKDEMGQLLELIAAFGAAHGVTFADEEKAT